MRLTGDNEEEDERRERLGTVKSLSGDIEEEEVLRLQRLPLEAAGCWRVLLSGGDRERDLYGHAQGFKICS